MGMDQGLMKLSPIILQHTQLQLQGAVAKPLDFDAIAPTHLCQHREVQGRLEGFGSGRRQRRRKGGSCHCGGGRRL